jgi:hypothetical protein
MPAKGNPEPFFKTSAMISSYRDTKVDVSYFDPKTGVETARQTFTIPAKNTIQVLLDSLHLRLTEPGDIPEFKSCHITADAPVNVMFFSTGACSGGSYLALPTPGLGKSYVVPSYDDNPANGAGEPFQSEPSGGFFLIISAFDSTRVTITPNGFTAGGHVGVYSGKGETGKPFPYVVTLQRGQCYWVKGDGSDDANDLSGSTVVSDKPIAVLAGHEDAFIGEAPTNSLIDGRDFMIEQVIPSEYWDSTGYVSIPLYGAQPDDPTSSGYGQNYRVFTNNPKGANIEENDCISALNNMSTGLYAYPTPEKVNVGCPIEMHSTDGHRFGVMCYEQREQGLKEPYPAESMMTIVPMSSWQRSFLIYVPPNRFEALQDYYLNFIGEKNDIDNTIMFSHNGGTLSRISTLSSKGAFNGIPNHPELKGIRYSVQPGSYYFTNPRTNLDPNVPVDTMLRGRFMVYNYGMRSIDGDLDLGDFDGDDFFFSYANPAGALLSSGDPANFKVTVDSQCAKWNICVQDLRKSNRGIRSVSLINDPTGVQFSPGKQFINCHIDPSIDVNTIGEAEFAGTDSVVCFSVDVTNALLPSYAPILVTDNAGNNVVVDLHYNTPPKFSVSPANFVLNFADVLGHDSCSSVTVRNSDSISHTINTASWSVGKDFVISSTIPALPVTLKHNDSLKINICFQAKDTFAVSDNLLFNLDCLPVQIAVSGSGGTGFIYASDKDFGRLFSDSTVCDTVGIYNQGKYPFTITSVSLSGSTAFSFTDAGLLPLIIPPNQKRLLHVCYTPHGVGSDSTIIQWNTDITAPFTETPKGFSVLKGERAAAIVWDRKNQDYSVICDDSEIVRVWIFNTSNTIFQVDSVYINGLNSSEWYIAGVSFGYTPIPKFNLKPGDSVWVDVVFKPELSRPLPARYADRTALLEAIINGEANQIINFTGHVRFGAPFASPDSLKATFKLVGVGGTSSVAFTVSDTGTGPLVVESISPLTYPIFNFSGISPGDSIFPGNLRNVNIDLGFNFPLSHDTVIYLTITFNTSCAESITIPIDIKPVSSSVKIADQTTAVFSILPNPATGNAIIVSLAGISAVNAELKIFDVLGRELIVRDFIGKDQIEIPIRNLHNGIYYAQVSIGGKVLTQKFEVTR